MTKKLHKDIFKLTNKKAQEAKKETQRKNKKNMDGEKNILRKEKKLIITKYIRLNI